MLMEPTVRKILVIDDAVFFTTVINNTLSAAGYEVAIAQSAEEAQGKLKESIPDLILLDVVMPGMSGFDLCKTIRNNTRYCLIPVIIITGQNNDDDRFKGLELGADDYIIKPFASRELLARIHNTLLRIERVRNLNPITWMRGNNDIDEEIRCRIEEKIPYAVLYIDINDFKAYNDVYGFARGDICIRFASACIVEAVGVHGAETDFIGHIGGDDFVAIVEPELAIDIAKDTIARFEKGKSTFFCDKDNQNGYMVSTDRNNAEQRFPLMGLAIAIIMSENQNVANKYELAKKAADLKHRVKDLHKSAYMVD